MSQLLESQMSEVFQPTTLTETLSLLHKFGSRCKIIAGGTDLMVDLKNKGLACNYLISLDRVTDRILKSITFKGRKLTIGAAVQVRTIESSPMILRKAPLLAEVARTFATTQIRNVATVGGNLCRASPAADFAPALLALNAEVNLKSSLGSRTVPLRYFFLGPGQNVLKRNELVASIAIDLPSRHGGAFMKYTPRSPHDLATVNAAAVIIRDRSRKRIQSATIALGAVAPTPIIAVKASKFLQGKNLNNDACAEASELAVKESRPITDARASSQYRKKMTLWVTRGALQTSWERS
jgi:carbon-monoxide dehydrogenase medium subunit